MAEKEEETRRLFGVGPPTPGYNKKGKGEAEAEAEAKGKAMRLRALQEWKRTTSRGFISAYKAVPVSMKSEEESRRLLDCCEPAPWHPVPAYEEADARRAARRRACNWLRLLFFPRSVPEPALSAEELDAQFAALHDQKVLRCSVSRSELRAINHKIVLQCLEWYNSKHPGNEYEPAPGVVTRRSDFNNSLLWTHGNFVARRKRSSRFSFLPAPRTLFFFELLDRYDVDEVITCTPLDEPVTEAYIFRGFRLGWGTRRDGRCDCVCKTCYRQFHVPHMDLKRTCACGDSKVEGVCNMCYLTCDVLHPFGGGFAFGHNKESFAYC